MKFDPWKEIEQMRKRMDNLVGYFNPEKIELGTKTPAMDIYREENDLIVEIDLPGVDKENIDLSIEEDTISVSAKKREIKEEEKEDFYRSERVWKDYQRIASLPVKVDPSKVKAKYDNGTLRIKAAIQKPEKTKRKKVKVE